MKALVCVALLAVMAMPAAGTAGENAQLSVPKSGTIKVAFVLSEDATVIDFAGPWEVFQDTDSSTPFELYTVAPSKAPLHSSGNQRQGLTITPDYSFADAPEPDLVVIGAQSGGPGLAEWLQRIHQDRKTILSVCTGAFRVAQAGLLDGRQATTHHEYLDRLARQYPKVKVISAVRYVQSEPFIYTAGGLTSGVDLALHIVEQYFGRATAQKTADYMEYQGTGWKTP